MPVTIDLTGKNALVTGGSRGIGYEISKLLSDAGATVCMTYRADAQSANEAVKSLDGVDHFALQADLSNEGSMQEAGREALSLFHGHLDIVIANAAGRGEFGSFTNVSLNDWKKPMEANVFGHVALLQVVGPCLRPGGSVVFISSGAGHDPIEGFSAYGSSKAAINQLATVLAQEWGPNGIRVNVVSPGSTSHLKPDYDNLSDRQKNTIAHTALRRLGTATDVANTVLYFASDLSSFVTGQWVRVNGGRI